MNIWKKHLKILPFWSIAILVYILLLTTLNYFQIIRYNSIPKINFIVMTITTFILGLMHGKFASKKGYIEGLKIGFTITGILFLLNIFLIRKFTLSIILYYLIIIISSIVGSIIGINLKKKH